MGHGHGLDDNEYITLNLGKICFFGFVRYVIEGHSSVFVIK
jgi:hypothetical protein